MTLPLVSLMRSATVALPALLCACGGGGASAPSPTAIAVPPATGPQAPTLTLTPTAAKTFRFTWPDVADETEYRLLEDPDGASGYTRVATLPADTTTHEQTVFLPERINARYILQACQAGTCLDSASASVAGTLEEAIGFLKSSGPADEDAFGYSVALSDDNTTLAIGAPGESSDHAGISAVELAGAGELRSSGAVYVFVRQGQAWQQQAFVKASDPVPYASFGRSLALNASGNTLAVGAPEAGNTGAVYVFIRQGQAWTEQQRVAAGTPSIGGAFGLSLGLSAPGDVLVVGDPQEDSIASDSGAAYVFTRTGNAWTEQALLKAPSPQARDGFGMSVSVNGNGDLLAAGSPDDSGTILFGGAVYVFEGGGSTWGPPTRLTTHHLVVDQGLGGRVALSRDGSTLAASALRDASAATGIGGDADAGGAPNSGAVHVFSRLGIGWAHQAYLKASNTDQDDNFGRSLALSQDGNTLVVGAPYERGRDDGLNGNQASNGGADVGAAYVFRRNGLDWRQQAYVKAANSATNDEFGWGMALSSDGQTLAIGAPGESSSGSGWGAAWNNDSPFSGAVYLY